MSGYTVEQKRTFARVASYISVTGIGGIVWEDVALDEDGSFLEIPDAFPDDFDESTLTGLMGDDTAEEEYEGLELVANLDRDKDVRMILLSELLNELAPGRRDAIIRNTKLRVKAKRQARGNLLSTSTP